MHSDVATDGLADLAPEDQPRNGGGGRREIILRVISALILAPLGARLAYAPYAGGELRFQVADGMELDGAARAVDRTHPVWSTA